MYQVEKMMVELGELGGGPESVTLSDDFYDVFDRLGVVVTNIQTLYAESPEARAACERIVRVKGD